MRNHPPKGLEILEVVWEGLPLLLQPRYVVPHTVSIEVAWMAAPVPESDTRLGKRDLGRTFQD